MIVIPENYIGAVFTERKFIALLEFMNNLEEELEYPICSGEEERLQRLRLAEMQLITQGYL